MSSRFLPLRALRYRTGQSVLLGLLALAAVTACAAGPMYERAVEQAALRSNLNQAAVADRGARIDSSSSGDAASYLPTGKQRALFGAPINGTEAKIEVVAPKSLRTFENTEHNVVGIVATRTDYCAHLKIVQGKCPTGSAELAISSSSANAFKLKLGDTLQLEGAGAGTFTIGGMSVVGVYQPFDSQDDYWFDRSYSSAEGMYRQPNGDAPDVLHPDAFFVSSQAIAAIQQQYESQVGAGTSPFTFATDLPLDVPRTSVDDIGVLRAALAGIQNRIAKAHAVGDPQRGTLTTNLPALLDTADKGRQQTRIIIPTLAAELGLVILVLLGMVIAVGVDQRRPELALARLRGRGKPAAARFFIGEITALVTVALIPGLAVAWLVCTLLCKAFLPSGVVPEWRWPVLAAGVAVSLVALLAAVVMARRAAAQPIGDLLRSVPRRSGRSVGLLEVGVGIAALAGVVVVLTGGDKSALALITPGLIAILAGLVLSRIILTIARRVGVRAMWTNRLATAVSALHVARSPNFRRIVTLVCVAVALAVSSVDQWSVAGTERHARAQAQVGAAVVLTVQAPSALALQETASTADPGGTYAMPVVVETPAGGDTPLMAVGEKQFRSVADWGSSRDTPSASTVGKLAPINPPKALDVAGSLVQLAISSVQVAGVKVGGADTPPDQRPQAVSLRLYFRLRDGVLTTTTLPLKTMTSAQTVTAVFGGCKQGCQLSRVELLRAAGDFSEAKVRVALADLSVGEPGALQSLALGRPADWGNVNADAAAAGSADQIAFTDSDGSGLTLDSDSHGSSALLQHLDIPVALPCLVAGTPSGNKVGKNGLAIHGIDNTSVSCVPVGKLAFAPRVGRDVVVVDLSLAIGVSTAALTSATSYLWLSQDDPKRERALRATMANKGLLLVKRETAAQFRAQYDDSPPAWSIQVALMTACAAAVVSALMVVIVAYTSRRGRSRDLSALRLVGVPLRTVRRGVMGEQLVAVVLGSVIGAVVGVIGARLALPAVPLFVRSASYPEPTLATAWSETAVAAVAALVLLVVAAVVAGWLVVRRLSPDRLREGGL
ncbi:MAG: FtsX-like permease family protein [Jatrophihabitans sp.]